MLRHPRSTLFPYTTLFRSAPGVVSQTGQDDAKVGVYGNVAYSMNGGRTEYNNWELDGGDNMDNGRDRKSTRLNSSHVSISYAVFCLKKKKEGMRHTL